MSQVGIIAKSNVPLVDVFRVAGWQVTPLEISHPNLVIYLRQDRPDLLICEFQQELLPSRIQKSLANLEIPWIVIVDQQAEADQAMGWEASEVVFAPFKAKEVLWRAQRLCGAVRTRAQVGDLKIDLAARLVQRGEQIICLSANEFHLLKYLSKHQGKIVSMTELLAEVWQCSNGQGGTADQVKCCIMRLRKKIEPDHSRPQYIVSIKGLGYLLKNQA